MCGARSEARVGVRRLAKLGGHRRRGRRPRAFLGDTRDCIQSVERHDICARRQLEEAHSEGSATDPQAPRARACLGKRVATRLTRRPRHLPVARVVLLPLGLPV